MYKQKVKYLGQVIRIIDKKETILDRQHEINKCFIMTEAQNDKEYYRHKAEKENLKKYFRLLDCVLEKETTSQKTFKLW